MLDAVLGKEEKEDLPIIPPPSKRTRNEDLDKTTSYASVVSTVSTIKPEENKNVKSVPLFSSVTGAPSTTSTSAFSSTTTQEQAQEPVVMESSGVTRLLMATKLEDMEEGEVQEVIVDDQCYSGSGEVMLEQDNQNQFADIRGNDASVPNESKPKSQFPLNWADSDTSSDEGDDDVL